MRYTFLQKAHKLSCGLEQSPVTMGAQACLLRKRRGRVGTVGPRSGAECGPDRTPGCGGKPRSSHRLTGTPARGDNRGTGKVISVAGAQFSTSPQVYHAGGGHVNAPSLWKLLVPVHSKHQDTVTSPSTAAGAHLRVTESARDAVLTQPHLRATAGLGPNHRSKASAAIR